MPRAAVRSANGSTIEIAYETVGDPGAVPLVLVHGLGMQLVGWHPDLIQQLAGRGYQVVIFDNRDAGQSTLFTDAGSPGITGLLSRDASAAGYTLAPLAHAPAGL